MKKSILRKIIPFLLIALSISVLACDKDDDGGERINNLVGTWVVSAIQVTSPSIGTMNADVSGTIKFNADGTGQEDYDWSLGSFSFSEDNGFTWTSSSNTITFDPGDVDQTIWTRGINEPDQQKGTYTTTENGELLSITITLIK